MRFIGLFVGLLSVSNAMINLKSEFESWMKTHEKNYETEEEHRYRFSVFTENYVTINHRNSLKRNISLALNKFGDLTNSEFRHKFLTGYVPREEKYYSLRQKLPTLNDLPVNVDWVEKGAVTPVKNQGQCGSCWSFSTTGSVEGAWFLKTGQLVSLSEQQLVDCSTGNGNQGCNGGLMDYAFQYIIQNGGICSEDSYPYTASDGTCNNCTMVAKISSYKDVIPNNSLALMTAVVQQPVSVAVEADGMDWQFYSGGVVTDACGTNLDHGVLVVGYGTDSTNGDYWKVKNSWGPDWGENGYIRIGRGSKFDPSGECGILMAASYPIV